MVMNQALRTMSCLKVLIYEHFKKTEATHITDGWVSDVAGKNHR
jgi:hypothetical protein